MGSVTDPEEAEDRGGRPWPAPSTGADWWRADVPEPDATADPHEPTGPHEPTDPDAASDGREAVRSDKAGPSGGSVPPSRPAPEASVGRNPAGPKASSEAPTGPAARPYDQPPRTPDRPETPTTTGPAAPRRASEPVAFVTAPVPVVPPVPVPPARPAPSNHSEPPATDPERPPGAPKVHASPARTAASVPAQRAPRSHPPRRPVRRRRPRKLPRRPWFGMPALLVLALATTFFAWVSAEPFWLAVGHGRVGTATVFAADDGCRAFFIAADGSFLASDVDLRGLGPAGCMSGAKVTAHMVSDRAGQAYATTTLGLHLRWLTGLALVVVSGLAIMWLTGATRFSGWRRGVAVGLSLAAPAAATIAMLTATF